MDIYRLGVRYSYTPDIEINLKDNKYGIVYLPTGETLLPHEYENILLTGESINSFIVLKNGKFGAVHLSGSRHINNDSFEKRSNLTPYNKKPAMIYDLPCEYDYFRCIGCNEFMFYTNTKKTYFCANDENMIIHFEEIRNDGFGLWGKKNNMLYLISSGKVLYKEPFNGFRFAGTGNRKYWYIDVETNDRLLYIFEFGGAKFELVKGDKKITQCHKAKNILQFYDKKIEFEYYSENYDLCFNGKPSIMNYNVKLLGIREKDGEHIRITPSFAHTMQYVGKNRFIVCCEDGKFGLCEIKYCGQIETEKGFENFYGMFPQFILYGYDYVNCLGDGYFEFISDDKPYALYDSAGSCIEDRFYNILLP